MHIHEYLVHNKANMYGPICVLGLCIVGLPLFMYVYLVLRSLCKERPATTCAHDRIHLSFQIYRDIRNFRPHLM